MEQLGEEGGQYAILEGEMGQSAQILRYEGLENTILANDKYEWSTLLPAGPETEGYVHYRGLAWQVSI